MITAVVGAALNVGLNLLLIPRMEAMGASIATFASYFAVCILRLITTHRLIPFKQEWLRGGVNTLLAAALTAVVTLSDSHIQSPVLAWGLAGGIFVLSASAMTAAADRNFKKWKIFGDRINHEPEHILKLKSYTEHADYLCQWLDNRYTWLDNYFSAQ